MLTDIEIASQAKIKPITEIGASLGITEEELSLYGKYKAKLTPALQERLKDKPEGKLILVTAVNPTPAGEGKTTVTVSLGQAFAKIGKKAVIALREPSLGPVMGIKGGAAGGGYSQVVPMEDINLHFTGDLHAITAANNLLSAMIDNHIMQGNELNIDVKQIPWKRVLDMNDRALRNIIVGLGGKMDGIPREDGFMITVASEIMATLCLADGLSDLKKRLARIICAYNRSGEPITAGDLKADGAMALLLKDAIQPNLVQTLEHTPCIMHGGPFANIAHGCNSVQATRLGLKLADYCITEAGFGADLGAEKFMDIKCRLTGLRPSAAVLVVTVRALKYNGGVPKAELAAEDLTALRSGLCNLEAHMENIAKFGVPCVVAINVFGTDTEAELEEILSFCRRKGVAAELCRGFAEGGAGAAELAKRVVEAAEQPSDFRPLYEDSLPLKEKIETVVRKIYGGDGITFEGNAKKQIQRLEELGFGSLPVCMAKTQYSLSDNPTLLGRPSGFTVTVREVRVSAGAGFVVVLTGNIMTMPGLPKSPAAERMQVSEDGTVTGLF